MTRRRSRSGSNMRRFIATDMTHSIAEELNSIEKWHFRRA